MNFSPSLLRFNVMPKLIRHRTTGAFFSTGEWVDDFRLAQAFNKYEEIDKCVKTYNLRDVELRYIHGDAPSTTCDWAIPLR